MPARVLVVDDILPNVKVLEAQLTAEYFEVTTATSGAEALTAMRHSPPDIVLLDVMMPEMDGFEVCRRIKEDPALAHIPVVMVTALSETAERVSGLEAGADDFLTKPVNSIALFARVRSLVRFKLMMDELRLREQTSTELGVIDPQTIADGEGERARILVVEDRADDARTISEALKDIAEVEHEPQGDNAVEVATAGAFDLILVSLALENVDGLRLCSNLRAKGQTRQASILALIEGLETDQLVRALEIGVSDYLVKPVDGAELLARVRTQIRRKRHQDRLRAGYETSVAMAVTDPLTGLHNRRYLESHLDNLVARANAGDKAISVMMLDLDHFKSINDTHGHAAGDEVLKEFGNRLRQGLRGIDLASRYGGEEFVVAMPDTDGETAKMVADRLRQFVADEPFEVDGDGKSVPVTVSIGVTASSGDSDSSKSMLERADRSLYLAKDRGRNRMVAEMAEAVA